jgi:CMP-N,N'-diacetyllegionaminic acid synthase
MKLIAIIPARGGSKRIPQKNTKPFMGKSLTDWTILRALKCGQIEKVVVSTNDPDILCLADQYSSVQFIERPDELCTDLAPTSSAILHAIEFIKEKFTHFILLQPTSPLRTEYHISAAIDHFRRGQSSQLVSVMAIDGSDINRSHVIEKYGTGWRFLTGDKTEFSDRMAVLNGAIYISKIDFYAKSKTFIGPHTDVFTMDSLSSIDIDVPGDWERALLLGNQAKNLFQFK